MTRLLLCAAAVAVGWLGVSFAATSLIGRFLQINSLLDDLGRQPTPPPNDEFYVDLELLRVSASWDYVARQINQETERKPQP